MRSLSELVAGTRGSGRRAGALRRALLAGLNREWIRSRWLDAGPRIDSLAVLPLENLSGEASEDYFADGMTEVLSTDLARLSGLRACDGARIGHALQGLEHAARSDRSRAERRCAGHGLGAAIGQARQHHRAAPGPGSGDQLWTNRYERDLEDVLALRNEIVSAIVREIRAQLSPGEQTRLATRGRVNADAFEAALKGRFHWLRQTREDFDQAERLLPVCAREGPHLCAGVHGPGYVWMMRGDAGFRPPSETVPIREGT